MVSVHSTVPRRNEMAGIREVVKWSLEIQEGVDVPLVELRSLPKALGRELLGG